ncbi:hypothetical protein D3C87_1734810 [compost metagenome]
MRRVSTRSDSPSSRGAAEFEAMGAQWDFLQAIPAESRKVVMEKVAQSSVSKGTKEMLIKDLELSFLPRDRFIREVSHYHGYNSANLSVQNATVWTSLLMGAPIVVTGSMIYEERSK